MEKRSNPIPAPLAGPASGSPAPLNLGAPACTADLGGYPPVRAMSEPTHPFDPAFPDEFDRTFRPRSLEEFVGQARVIENLSISLQASKARLTAAKAR